MGHVRVPQKAEDIMRGPVHRPPDAGGNADEPALLRRPLPGRRLRPIRVRLGRAGGGLLGRGSLRVGYSTTGDSLRQQPLSALPDKS